MSSFGLVFYLSAEDVFKALGGGKDNGSLSEKVYEGVTCTQD